MSLITKVKAGAVSSLSDARFFAGMGVDWLGFNVDPQSESFVNVDLYKSLVGWVSGPKRVIELPSNTDSDTFNALIKDYVPECIEIEFNEIENLDTDLPILARANLSNIQLNKITNRIKFLVLDAESNLFNQAELIKKIAQKTEILLTVSPDFNEIKNALKQLPLAGIALNGSKELKAGIKVYDYAELLESLEAEV